MADNHVLGFSYDNDGNVTNDGVHTYAYDAEGRPTTVDNVHTMFDAFGRAQERRQEGCGQNLRSRANQMTKYTTFCIGDTMEALTKPLRTLLPSPVQKRVQNDEAQQAGRRIDSVLGG